MIQDKLFFLWYKNGESEAIGIHCNPQNERSYLHVLQICIN